MLICDVLHDLVPFVQLKKRENTHVGMLLLVKLQAKKFQAIRPLLVESLVFVQGASLKI